MDLSLLLRDRFGFQEFRPAQKQVIDRVMAGENALAVMPTGSGKSLCYQLPALALPGVTLVVSPLIALMKDQVDQLNRLGLPATVINSTAQIVSGFDRPNLYLEVREVATNLEKIRAIIELSRWAPLGIVYAGTRKNVEEIYSNLRRAGIQAAAYHAGLALPERKAIQDKFMKSSECVIVAT